MIVAPLSLEISGHIIHFQIYPLMWLYVKKNWRHWSGITSSVAVYTRSAFAEIATSAYLF